MNAQLPPLTEKDALSLLDAKFEGRWRRDREGWVTVERRGVAWRVHYRRGTVLEVWNSEAEARSNATSEEVAVS